MTELNPQHARSAMLKAAEKQCAKARASGQFRVALVFANAIQQCLEYDNPGPLRAVMQLERFPVTIDEFVESRDFLGQRVDIWPALMEDLRRLNPDVFIGEEPVHEAYLGGATSIGKSTLARITLLYQIYLLTCLRSPQELFGLEPQTKFVFPLQSVAPEVTRRVLYEPIRQMFEEMPFAKKYLNWKRRRTVSLEIDGGIHVVPVLAGVEPLLGQAIPGCILDEVNFMHRVERSKRVAGPRGLGGLYDQAEETARELSQRRKSRFLNSPISVGTLIYCSSTRYIGDFLDRRIDEIEASPRSYVFWSRHARFAVVPKDRYCGETFGLLVGDKSRRTRPLEEDEEAPPGSRVEEVPVEFLDDFRRDPETALRTIVGIAVGSLTPFIDRRETIEESIDRWFDLDLWPWTCNSEIILDHNGWPEWIEDAMPSDRQKQRFVHIDLSLSRDACGIAVVKLQGFREESRGDNLIEAKPQFVVEAALSIKPSPDREILISEVKSFVSALINQHRLNIVQVNSDGYRAADFQQAFRSLHVRVQEISVDKDPAPYEYLRDCLYEGRLALVDSEVLERELIELERNRETQRVDHPPRGSKDVSDAVAGALFAAVSSRYVRARSGFFDSEGRRPQEPRPNPTRPPGMRRR